MRKVSILLAVVVMVAPASGTEYNYFKGCGATSGLPAGETV